jgi:hypothetical protein
MDNIKVDLRKEVCEIEHDMKLQYVKSVLLRKLYPLSSHADLLCPMLQKRTTAICSVLNLDALRVRKGKAVRVGCGRGGSE